MKMEEKTVKLEESKLKEGDSSLFDDFMKHPFTKGFSRGYFLGLAQFARYLHTKRKNSEYISKKTGLPLVIIKKLETSF